MKDKLIIDITHKKTIICENLCFKFPVECLTFRIAFFIIQRYHIEISKNTQLTFNA